MVRTLRRWQAEALPIALTALTDGKRGIIRAATGAGKSILQARLLAQALPLLSEEEVCVVTVPSQSLVEQLASTLREELGEELVGRYYASHKELRRVIVTCHPSLYNHADPAPYCPECHPDREGVELSGGRAQSARLRLLAAAVSGSTGCAAHQSAPHIPLPTRGLATTGLKVGLWLADEAHKTECDAVLDWVACTQPRMRIGFTATPWRSSTRQQISSFDELLYDYGPSQAIDEGVLHLPTCIFAPPELDGLPVQEAVAAMVRRHLAAHGGAGVISTRRISEAEEVAAHLTSEGIRCAAIHSRQPRETQQQLLDALRDGEYQALTYVSLLAEGVDLPWLSWLCLARPATTAVRFPQEIGRIMRTCEGKTGCHVLDPLGVYLNTDFESEIRLGDYEETVALQSEQSEEESETESTPKLKAISAIAPSEVEAWIALTHKRGAMYGAWPKVKSAPWQKKPVTARQIALIEEISRGLAGRADKLPAPDYHKLRACYAHRAHLTCGSASKLVEILKSVRKKSALY